MKFPRNEEAELSPTELPFTEDDFELQFEQSLELMPEVLGDETGRHPPCHQRPAFADRRRLALLGETVEVKGLWSVAAVWIKEGPGIGRAVAEWMTDGYSRN